MYPCIVQTPGIKAHTKHFAPTKRFGMATSLFNSFLVLTFNFSSTFQLYPHLASGEGGVNWAQFYHSN